MSETRVSRSNSVASSAAKRARLDMQMKASAEMAQARRSSSLTKAQQLMLEEKKAAMKPLDFSDFERAARAAGDGSSRPNSARHGEGSRPTSARPSARGLSSARRHQSLTKTSEAKFDNALQDAALGGSLRGTRQRGNGGGGGSAIYHRTAASIFETAGASSNNSSPVKQRPAVVPLNASSASAVSPTAAAAAATTTTTNTTLAAAAATSPVKPTMSPTALPSPVIGLSQSSSSTSAHARGVSPRRHHSRHHRADADDGKTHSRKSRHRSSAKEQRNSPRSPAVVASSLNASTSSSTTLTPKKQPWDVLGAKPIEPQPSSSKAPPSPRSAGRTLETCE